MASHTSQTLQMGGKGQGERKNRWPGPSVPFPPPKQCRGQTIHSGSGGEGSSLLRQMGKGVEGKLPIL